MTSSAPAATHHWPTVTPDATSIVPLHVDSPADAAAVIAANGAAILAGIGSADAAVDAARAVLGDREVRVNLQFDATKSRYVSNQAKAEQEKPDARGRVRRFTAPEDKMFPHNDGFGFGDLGPDYLFLYCERPCPTGGASWLIDGPGLLQALAVDPGATELARFCWETEIDHSEPSLATQTLAPIARRLPSGRVQVRHHNYQAAALGPDESAGQPFVDAWHDAVHTARDRANRFSLQPGQLLCADNYRVFHGRDPFVDPARLVISIWGWSTEAIAVPTGDLAII
jgi:hypothetical protein